MTPEQAERIACALERIAAAMEKQAGWSKFWPAWSGEVVLDERRNGEPPSWANIGSGAMMP